VGPRCGGIVNDHLRSRGERPRVKVVRNHSRTRDKAFDSLSIDRP
jgi:hypothetical protein